MAETLSTIGTMVGADIKDLRLTKIDTEVADNKYIRTDLTSGVQTISSDLEILGTLGKQYQSREVILANESLDIDLKILGIDGLNSIYDIKILDEDETSDTYDTYINAEPLYLISIFSDGTSCKIINLDTVDHTFLINIKYI